MSFLRNPFSIRKTKPRKAVSRAPFRFPAEELGREFGQSYQSIDARIGDQQMVFDIQQGEWRTDGIPSKTISAREMTHLDKKKHELEAENNILRTKMDILMTMLTEVTAEQALRTGHK